MNKVYRSGLIPYWVSDTGEIEMIFMKPSDPVYGGDCFQISKGKVEDGETFKEAAIREAQEELGLLPCNIVNDVWFLDTYLGRMSVYVCRVADKDLFGVPGYETGDVAWMTLKQFLTTGRELHRFIVEEAHSKILTVENPHND